MPDRWSLPRSTASAALLVELAGEHGVAAGVLLKDTEIRPAQLIDAEAEITAGQELRLVENLVARLGDVPALGLEAGTRYDAATHGVWGWAVISSATVRQAVEVGARYSELSFAFSDIRWHEEGEGDVRIVYDDKDTPHAVRRFMAERDLAATVTVARDLMGTVLPAKEVRLCGPDLGYTARIEALVEVSPMYDAPVSSALIAREMLDLPLPQANPHVAAVWQRQAAEVLQRRVSRVGLAGQVRDLLVRRTEMASQEDVARELNLSVRTLQRQLAEEGTSYRELSGEVSCLLAEELLRAGLPVEDVAHRLGYATASSLTHAYRRWRGTTPGRYARQVRQRVTR